MAGSLMDAMDALAEQGIPPYSVTIDAPGRRWRIVHRTSTEECTERVYFVAANESRTHLDCSCPAGRYGRPCKHKRFVRGAYCPRQARR